MTGARSSSCDRSRWGWAAARPHLAAHEVRQPALTKDCCLLSSVTICFHQAQDVCGLAGRSRPALVPRVKRGDVSQPSGQFLHSPWRSWLPLEVESLPRDHHPRVQASLLAVGATGMAPALRAGCAAPRAWPPFAAVRTCPHGARDHHRVRLIGGQLDGTKTETMPPPGDGNAPPEGPQEERFPLSWRRWRDLNSRSG